MCALVLLHFAHDGTRFSSSCPPPRSTSIRWSACVAGAVLHQWHVGLPRSMTCLFRRYAPSLCACPMFIASRALLVLARAVALADVCVRWACCQLYVCGLFSVCQFVFAVIKPSALCPRAFAS